MTFDPKTIKTFRFISAVYHEKSQQAHLNYAFDRSHYFTETLTFPNAKPLTASGRLALKQVLQQLHLVAGISYYKAALPAAIQIETTAISQANAQFLNQLYQHGLGEFSYCNQQDLQGKINFPYQKNHQPTPALHSLRKKTIVPVGGGKDSVVSIELLRQSQVDIDLFSVGQSKIIQNVVDVSGLPYLKVLRQLSPHLFELNQQGAYNGHVPISAILAYIMAAAAILYDFDTVVMSNERSANVGNLSWHNQEINHQYSKSLAFEQAVQQQFSQLLPDFNYFSLLRPLSELHIARLFAQATAYHGVFSSCNHNYRIHKKQNHQGVWCLNCPKCRFVFLALAPFIPQQKLIKIFGHNLLTDPQQQTGFSALLGINQHKPFECVGEIEESQVALYLLSQQPDWRDLPMLKYYQQQLNFPAQNMAKKMWQVFNISDQHNIPPIYESLLDNELSEI